MESYQAIYDAVRSRISGCDVGSAVESAINNAGIGHSFSMAADRIAQSFSEYERPCVLFKPKLSLDGDQWCALYGVNLAEGVAGFGKSPSEAMYDFDRSWCAKIESKVPA